MSSDSFNSTLSNGEVNPPINILLVEDVAEDVELILLSLDNADLKFTYDVAETVTIYEEKLQHNTYDAVLADYRLPGFNGLEALAILQQSGQKIPFILVTGSLGEEAAVECIKAGITDYLLKDRLFRLPNILKRSLEEFALRRQQQQATLERQKAETALRESEQRFRALIENAIDIILIVSSEGNLTYLSPSVKRILGYDPVSLMGQGFWDLIHPDDQEAVKLVFDRIKGKANQSTAISEFRVQTDDNRWIILEAIAKNLENDPTVAGFVINCHDITERHYTAQQLRYDAYHDKLTGLANRSALLEQLKQAITRNQRRREDHFALLFLDLDRFKVINDSLGHLMGDELLKNTAQRLEHCHREGDLLARFGGDEFVFLLRDIQQPQEAIIVAQRIHEVLKAPFTLNNREIFISASIGITISTDRYDHPEQILRDADAAMYRAKAKGKACHEIFAPTMHLSALKELHLESDLRQAIQRKELVVYYQPIFRLDTQQIIGAEALVRWHPPGKSLIPPNDFIPIAEETGLIIDIDRWVLQCACQQLHQWQKEFKDLAPHFISVNLSPKQFSDPYLTNTITEIISATELPKEYLKLEITETVFLKNSNTVLEILSQLQQLNIQICLDDFGTGYSSLSYLHRFPLNSLKIDRSFVSHLGQTTKNDAIVRIVGSLANELELELIAEGIEESYQIEALNHLGYQWGQGYYFSPPIDDQAFSLLLKKNRIYTPNK
ncbi:unknown [Crocosphaera subtropica ATCC 51142]|uniref:Two-component response regulator n=1 Tax=Crocosphaera subtropica (strain ATCC 51142 / BH68) TaxID=43989 RepID=B1WXC7_CROS5|nr:EAL domain-containing protein [Crocosphaera subtropica]ACB50871.1 unknown [Crocosphaera subtropica ATCC 51142]